MRKYLIPLAATAAFLSASQAYGAQTSDNFQARVTIQTACIVNVSDLDFGPVGVILGTEITTAAVAVNCSAGTPFTMSFNNAAPPAPAVTNYSGVMVNGVEDVAYSAVLSGAGGTGVVNFTINGSLPVQVTPPANLYTDNRTLYVFF